MVMSSSSSSSSGSFSCSPLMTTMLVLVISGQCSLLLVAENIRACSAALMCGVYARSLFLEVVTSFFMMFPKMSSTQ